MWQPVYLCIVILHCVYALHVLSTFMMCVSICQPSHRTRIYRILPKGITFQVVFLLYLGHPLFVLAFFDFGGGGLDVIVTVAGQMFVRLQIFSFQFLCGITQNCVSYCWVLFICYLELIYLNARIVQAKKFWSKLYFSKSKAVKNQSCSHSIC